MEARKGMRWYLVNGIVELSWFLGWAMFCSLATVDRPFPFFETIAVFALAGFITHFSTGKGWRIVAILGLEIIGLIGGSLLLIHGIYFDFHALLDGGWLSEFLDGPRSVSEGFVLSMNLLLIAILWILGVALARRPKGYHSACNRFDLGLAAFFALFLIKLVALTRGEAFTADSLSFLFIFPFFLFGLLAIGMARVRGAFSNTFLPGYQGIGVIASFVAVVLLGAGGLLLFFLPGLAAAAQTGYRTLAVLGRPLVPVLIALLRFVFGPRNTPPAEVAMRPSSPAADWDQMTPQSHGWWMELLERTMGWGLMLLTMLFALTILLFYVLKWLVSRTEGNGRRKNRSRSSRFSELLALLAGAWRKMIYGIRGYPKAAELFGALRGWAGRSGFPHDHSETPLELGVRLNARFPALAPQIELIVGAYNREVYGEAVLDRAQLAEMNSAWRLLCSPVHWPARLKGRVVGS